MPFKIKSTFPWRLLAYKKKNEINELNNWVTNIQMSQVKWDWQSLSSYTKLECPSMYHCPVVPTSYHLLQVLRNSYTVKGWKTTKSKYQKTVYSCCSRHSQPGNMFTFSNNQGDISRYHVLCKPIPAQESSRICASSQVSNEGGTNEN